MSASAFDTSVVGTLADLNALYVYVTGVNVVAPVPAEVTTANKTALNLVRRYLDRLGPTGDLGRGLLDGSVALDRWVQIANAQGYALNDVLKTLGDEQYLSRLWQEVVVATGQDVATVVKQGAAGFGAGAGLGLVALAALYLGGKLK